VDEIIDIIEEALELGMGGTCAGVLGSAVLRGKTTDIIDVAHFLPEMAGGTSAGQRRKPKLLLVEPTEFMRAMLAPVLQAAGYDVQTSASAHDALRQAAGGSHAVIVGNLEAVGVAAMPGQLGNGPVFIGLATRASRAVLDAAHQSGFRDVVGMFDRQGLLATLAEATSHMGEAA
ncbi:MAG: hybrid sensor histidine kinase/response regulator, partial [Beijerinckiaceae bacterium]